MGVGGPLGGGGSSAAPVGVEERLAEVAGGGGAAGGGGRSRRLVRAAVGEGAGACAGGGGRRGGRWCVREQGVGGGRDKVDKMGCAIVMVDRVGWAVFMGLSSLFSLFHDH